ncbi:TIGR00730 family Rossman fold protein [Candidatus Babeliales bacterium]|nr:TIGR00730 family Rossman fold protein [Candidatus Babeliales bacterium]MCF7899452.1 TIGR00730 family Rossman fold protein [Candidatus Babeliales bacterium]
MLKQRLREYFKFLKSLFKTNIRLLYGMWRLTKLPQPAITIFGSARVDSSSEIYQQARKMAKLLAAEEFSIITGGGPGIMDAANQGAIDHLKEKHLETFLQHKEIITAGIGLIRLNKEFKSPFVQEYMEMQHFFARKWLLVRYSVGFVVFPGGFGTLDELLEVITLVQCNRMAKVPIVLINRTYWAPFLQWVEKCTQYGGFIDKDDADIITVFDDIELAAKFIIEKCCTTKQSVLHKETDFKE